MSEQITVEYVARNRPRKMSKVTLSDQRAFDAWLDRNVNRVVIHTTSQVGRV